MRVAIIGLVLGVTVAACGGGSHPDHVEFSSGVDADLYRGPDHCGWDGTWHIWIDGWEIRSHFTGDNEDLFTQALAGGSPWVFYVRNPDRITAYSYEATPVLDTILPPDASLVSTSGSYELWSDPSDPHHLYVDNGTTVEAWVLATQAFACE